MPNLHAAPPVGCVSRPTFKIEFHRELAWWTQIEAGPYRLNAWIAPPLRNRRRIRLHRSVVAIGWLNIFIFGRRPEGPGLNEKRHLAPVRTEEPAMR